MSTRHDAHGMARSAFLVSVGGLVSLAAGTATQMVIAALFGAGRDMDAYFTSVAVPTYLAAVFLTGLNFVLVPAVIREEEEGRLEDAWRLVVTALAVALAIGLALTVAVEAGAPTIIRIIAAGMSPEEQDLTVALLRIQILAFPFMAAASMASGVLNTRGSFLRPALAPALGSIANLLAVLVLHRPVGVMSLAWGSAASYGMVALVTLGEVFYARRPQFLRLGDPRLAALGRLALPFVLFGLLQRAAPLMERYYASSLPDGQLSYLGYATKVSDLVRVMVGTGIATSILPAMSRRFEERGRAGLGRLAEEGLVLSLAVAVPAVVFFMLGGTPFVEVFLGRGRFDAATSLAVGAILGWAGLDVLFLMLGNVLGRTYYVLRNTWLGPLISTFSVLLYTAIAVPLTAALEYRGLMIARTASAGLAVVAMTLVLMRLLGVRFGAVWRAALLFVGYGGVVWLALRAVLARLAGAPSLAQLLVAFVGTVGAYALLYRLYDRRLFSTVLELAGLSRLRRLSGLWQGAAQAWRTAVGNRDRTD